MENLPQHKITLADVLDAKETKARIQNEMREAHKTPVIGIGINMPGPTKYDDETLRLLQHALSVLRNRFRESGATLKEERVYHRITGPIAILAVDAPADTLKQLAVEVEEISAHGRLLDIDVFDIDGRQVDRVSRGLTLRRCLVCEESAVECMRSRRHSSDDLVAAARNLLACFRADSTWAYPQAVEMIGTAALTAMLMEAACAPAPGLVDRYNSGAHHDMDFFTFVLSSSALAPSMYRCAMAGWEHRGEAADLLPILRRIGMKDEKSMFAATQGINTQKGLLFLLGILAAAAARVQKNGPSKALAIEVSTEAAKICGGIVGRELASLKRGVQNRKMTAGERFYIQYGVTGIRGEIEAGLPTVHDKGLPLFREAIGAGLHVNDALIHALIGIMSLTEDTTILNRHGLDALTGARRDASAVLAAGGMLCETGRNMVQELDERYSAAGISPGGSADLVAATYFLHRLEEIFSSN